MRNEQDKAKVERMVFLKFVENAHLDYDLSTIRKGEISEPEILEPDILCKNSIGEYVAFEITELCDEKIAKISNTLKDEEKYFRTDENSLVRGIERKLTRRYTTPYPIELICYINNRTILTANILQPTILDRLKVQLNAAHPFRKIWLLSEIDEVERLWSNEQ